LNKDNMGSLIKAFEDQLRANLSATHIIQNVDFSYCPMLKLPPGIPPHDTAANLYVRCQSYATGRIEKSV
jgi:hypothetical protein